MVLHGTFGTCFAECLFLVCVMCMCVCVCMCLRAARECFKKWGCRRCEDICWVKTNIKNPANKTFMDQKAVFQNTKEHCLMGR